MSEKKIKIQKGSVFFAFGLKNMAKTWLSWSDMKEEVRWYKQR